ncbi:uncharacterized protein LOC133325038 [Musca vetustissima]|uniref:uncharacterized protein LOC133325038 n=1 Tax=Musca vetustissima TaxID=27455 RepID=UPI002AB66F6A|nr:uncharacterized protein LOC133325038 [Musca vetustissima]
MLASTEDESPKMPFNYMSDVNAKVAAVTPASVETNSPPGEQTASTANTAVNVGEHTKAGDKMIKSASSTPKASSKCPEFIEMRVNERWDFIPSNNLCLRCFKKHHIKRFKSKRQCGVDNCKMPHNSLLHKYNEQQHLKQVENKQVNENVNNNSNHSVLFHVKEKVLFKYIPVTLFGNDNSLNTYALIDEGASCSLIESELVDQLGVDGPSEELCLQWTGEITQKEETSKTVSLYISDRKQTSKFLLKNIRTVTRLDLPVQTLSPAQIKYCEHFNGLPIIPYTAVRARIIIGLDNAKLCVPLEVKEADGNELITTRCKIGWGVYGRQQSNGGPVHRVMHICSCNKGCSDLDEQLKYFFSLDAVGVAINQNPLRSVEDERAKVIMDETTKYLEREQRWETGLLWKHNEVSLPNSLCMARRRLLCLEAKMKRDADLHKFLVDKIREYETKGYVRKLKPHEIRHDNKSWFIPIFTVKNKNKNKTRIVWDAAASVENVCLNSVLLKGPNLLKSLVGVLIRFRERPFAICGDIREMYHQIKLKEDEQCFQQFLWRHGDSTKAIDVYVMQVLTFGASCSPSLANYVKNRNAERFVDKYPCAVNSILSNTFVDDWLQSVDNEDEMLNLATEVRSIHKDGGFEMRNWLSNSEKVLNILDDSSSYNQKAFEDPEDASIDPYAAVAYLRVKFGDTIKCSILASKTRVAPLKPISIPRMELMAAILGLRLCNFIETECSLKINQRIFWTDSKDVLYWIKSDARKFHQFVAVRIGEILEGSKISEWRWVPSSQNVADDATKWNKNPDLEHDSRWFNGPSFLNEDEESWPKSELNEANNPVEVICHVSEVKESYKFASIMPDLNNFSVWEKLHRCLLIILNFLRKLFGDKKTSTDLTPFIQNTGVHMAEFFAFKVCQEEVFLSDMEQLKLKGFLSKKSSLYKSNPYLDEIGILRIKGRIDEINGVAMNVKRPIILPKKHKITKLIVDYYHRKYHHQHNEIVVNEMRQLFYIPGLRAAVRAYCKECQTCKIRKATPSAPQMGNLPAERLAVFKRPFYYTGIDYFGPIEVAVGRRREKRWGVLFTCMTVRAVHIEIAPSLSTDSFLLVLKQFISRRGTPIKMLSDNATNFRGASRVLLEEVEKISSVEVERKFPTIEWEFIPPASPHMGGAWERMVRSVKSVLMDILPKRELREEFLRAALADVESILNSRPLTYIPLESTDMEALTPNHFLLGSSSGIRERDTEECRQLKCFVYQI